MSGLSAFFQVMEEALIKFAEHSKLKEADSVFVVIMSHGKLGAVLGVDWKKDDKDPDEFPINNIFTLLGPKKCPWLINKPKIIVIQACRGGDGHKHSTTHHGSVEEFKCSLLPYDCISHCFR